ncbi:MAG: hypothetical protein K0S61_151 [Anaerocolumna sp.]|jgi:hypothetical protein|nr:hypothetical protein [Anaerocolumna sp.]
MAIELYNYQKEAVNKLKSGSILCGGVGSGKSRTSLAYYFIKECQGEIKINGKGEFGEMKKPKDLYIITTAKKRDSLEWEQECAPFMISTKSQLSISGVKVVVDSWNNITKYKNIKNSFFIFDEQRLVGSGAWVKTFLKIVKVNRWILLSATPGDTWGDYIPVFVANNFYKNRTEFLRRHAVYNRFTKYPKVEKYIEVSHLCKLRDSIIVTMHYERPTISHNEIINVKYDKELLDKVYIKRWNIFKNKPINSIGELGYLMRKVVNSDSSRLEAIKDILQKHRKIIIFYNFDYELEMLKILGESLNTKTHEWNGHIHQTVPDDNTWLYLVQYTAGAEGWNCITTNAIIFYSQNYSYKIMVQSAGRIDRLNTPFKELYYYHLISNSVIDLAISKSLKNKKNFNMIKFIKE